MGRITSFSKQVIVFFLVTALIIRPSFAAVGGWTMSNPIAQGASTVYTGTKNIIINGADYVKKGTAIVTPTATGVAKVLARGVAGVALSVAVEQLLGAVDWVLDPANNRIVYYENPVASQASCNQILTASGMGAAWQKQVGVTSISCGAITYDKTSNVSCSKITYTYKDKTTYKLITNNAGNFCVSGQLVNEREEKYLPLDVVAQKVISNAQANNVNAQVATTAAAADMVAEAEKDDVKARPIAQQLENSASTKPADEAAADKANEATGEQTKNPDKPDTTDLKLEFPAFCGWAPIVCEAAQKVISFPITLTDWYETSKSKAETWATSISEAWTKVKEEYANKPEENKDTQLEIEIPQQEVDTEINFGGVCPAPLSSDINFMGINKTIEFSFDPVCQIAAFIKPVVISISAFSAALIVAGIRTEDD